MNIFVAFLCLEAWRNAWMFYSKSTFHLHHSVLPGIKKILKKQFRKAEIFCIINQRISRETTKLKAAIKGNRELHKTNSMILLLQFQPKQFFY